jgi:hypothetical protein
MFRRSGHRFADENMRKRVAAVRPRSIRRASLSPADAMRMRKRQA